MKPLSYKFHGNLFERRRAGKTLVIAVATIVVMIFLLISNGLVKELAHQERERMNIWAAATERLAKADVDADFDFLLSIIAQNNSIPVMITDSAFNISEFRNYKLPDKTGEDVSLFSQLSERNQKYLQKRLHAPGGTTPLREMANRDRHFIEVELGPGISQYIYYEDSNLLRTLTLYPYVQMAVMLILALILYLAVLYTKRAEQNRVWVGLSKETAHQLGTPISSLMAWSEYLQASGTDKAVTTEIDKDVKRLSVIAERFSKIGSQPEIQLEYINDVVGASLDYMSRRISGRVKIEMELSDDDHGVNVSRALIEWVMENLTKNAVDAMAGEGVLRIRTGAEGNNVWIEVSDTGKGIARKNYKTIFNPGYTTKKRGWGLGLTLVKRIVEEYHGGKIYVKESEPGKGTTFRIDLPRVKAGG